MGPMATWTPRRALALVIGQVVLAAAALLITGGDDAVTVGVLPGAWLITIGLTLAVLGANWLNVAFWDPAIRGPLPAPWPGAAAPLSAGAVFMTRLVIAFQFAECGLVLAVQLVAATVAILTAPSPPDAGPSLGPVTVSLIPALLGTVMNYSLSYQARRMAWLPPAASGGDAARAVTRERTAWYGPLGLGAARETHTHVIGALGLLVLPVLSARLGPVPVAVAGGLLTLGAVAVFVAGAQREIRHLVRERRAPR